jgi:hypothetical protein
VEKPFALHFNFKLLPLHLHSFISPPACLCGEHLSYATSLCISCIESGVSGSGEIAISVIISHAVQSDHVIGLFFAALVRKCSPSYLVLHLLLSSTKIQALLPHHFFLLHHLLILGAAIFAGNPLTSCMQKAAGDASSSSSLFLSFAPVSKSKRRILSVQLLLTRKLVPCVRKFNSLEKRGEAEEVHLNSI